MTLLFLAESKSIHSVRWIRYFVDQGDQVHWVSLSAPMDPAHVSGLHFYQVPAGPVPIMLARATGLARRLVRDVRPDVLHAHYAGTYGLVGALTRAHPFVLTAWGSDVLLAGKALVRGPLVRFALRRADVITCDAAHMRDAIVALGVDRSRIEIVYFGTNVQQFTPARRSDAVRRELRDGDGLIVTSVRTLDPIYDVESFVRAMPLILAAMPSTSFVVGGEGPERERLERLAAALGVNGRVRFVGMMNGERLADVLASSDVYVSTSTSDGGIAASTAEAMAAGLPAVITDFGENRDWVADGTSGYIVPLRSPERVAEAVICLLRNPADARQFGLRGREMIVARNNYHAQMAAVREVYLAQRRAR